MDIRNSLEGLRSLLGTAGTASTAAQPARAPQAGINSEAMGADRATLSSAASHVAQSASETGVRMDKVAGIQSALAAGTYAVPPAAVASKVVDAMLGAH